MTGTFPPADWPTRLPCGGLLRYSRSQDALGRPIVYVHVLPSGARGWSAEFADWPSARRYAEWFAGRVAA